MADFVISTDLAAIENTQIVANFDEVVAAVRELARPYQGVIVTEDTMRNAAADRAKLRKLRDRLDGQRKAVKAACMAPVEAFAQALNPALIEIDSAVENIDKQIKALEEASRADKMEKLEETFEALLTPEIEGFVSFEKLRSRHPKWANKGCTLTECENDIHMEIANIKRGVTALQGYPAEYRTVLLDTFSQRYDIADALEKYARLREVEEQERKREEMRKAQEAARKAQEERKAQEVNVPVQETAKPAEASQTPVTPIQDEVKTYDFRVWATREQIGKLREFLVGNRIRYGKVPKEVQ